MNAYEEGWQAHDAEDEICQKLSGCHAGLGRDSVRNVLLKIGVPREEHEVDAFSTDP